MSQEMLLRREELVNNPTPRIPVCLCLDTSSSMSGAPIEELNEGVSLFFTAIKGDEIAKYSAETAVVTFGDVAKKVVDFGSITRQSVPILQASGSTPMGAAVNLALDLLDARKKEYSSAGIDYYQPWLVLMTDGQPTDNIDSAGQRTVQLLEEKKLTIFPIGIGTSADMNVLARFSPNRTPLRLKSLNFRAFFEWLSKSVSRVSQSIPGERVPLDENGIKGWSEL
ncbi:vWA domain-containing protein [Sorangium sp. So ce1128]